MTGPRWSVCVLDGVVLPDGRVTIGADAEVLTHGLGLFETLPVIAGRPRFLAQHCLRFQGGARELGLVPAPEFAVVVGTIDVLRHAVGVDDFSVRLVLFRDGLRVHFLATASALPADVARPVKLGVAAPQFNGARALGRLKTLNYLAGRLAHADGAARGFDEVLLTMADGTVLEGTRSSVFAVAHGALITPPLTLPILPGVIRDVILQEARAAGVSVREEAFDLSWLATADEVFISASVRGLRPAISLDGQPLRGADAAAAAGGPVTARLQAAYQARFARG